MNKPFYLFKRVQLIIVVAIINIQSFAQVEDFNIQKALVQVSAEKEYPVLRHSQALECIGTKTYIQGIYGGEFFSGMIDKGGKLTLNDPDKEFPKKKLQFKYIPVGEKLLLVWVERDKDVFQIKGCYYDPIENTFAKEQILLDEVRKNAFTFYVDYHSDQLYIFAFSEPGKDETSYFNYVIANKNLSPRQIFKGNVPFSMMNYKEPGSLIYSNFLRDIYFDSKDRLYIYYMKKQDGKTIGQLKRFSATGEHSNIKINTGGKFFNHLFLKDVDDKTVLVTYTNYDKRPIVKDMHIFTLDPTDKEFTPIKSQSLDLFTDDDEKVVQYMKDFNPGRNAVPLRYEFVAKDIHKTADGGYLVVGRGFTICEGAGGLVGSPGNQTLESVPAQPGFFCIKLDKNYNKQWAQEFSTQFYGDDINSISIAKDGEVFSAVDYHKGFYKYASTNSFFIPDEFNLYKIDRNGHLSATTLEKAVDGIYCYTKTDNSFVVLLRTKTNKESKNTFYDKENEYILYKIDKK